MVRVFTFASGKEGPEKPLSPSILGPVWPSLVKKPVSWTQT